MSAGKGHAPRPVNGEVFRSNHDDIFRKEKWLHDPDPFESADHDNDCSMYDERAFISEPEEWHPRGIEWKPEHGRMLRSGERLQDGDEVYVGNDKWETIYLADFQEQHVRNGLYRRKGEDRHHGAAE